LIGNQISAGSVYLPNSVKELAFGDEAIMLLWKLVELNPHFKEYLCRHDAVLDIVNALLQESVKYATSPARIGYLRMSVFFLHELSSNRMFAIKLNTPCNVVVPSDLPRFRGCYADYVILAVCYMVFANKGKLSLNDSYLTIVANISPYIKGLSVVTSNKLLSMFDAVSTPAFLLQNHYNHALVFFLLDVFNNIIQYQFSGVSVVNMYREVTI
jgi:hypothetical protein